MNEKIEELEKDIERLNKRIDILNKKYEIEKANIRVNYFLNFIVIQSFLVLYIFDYHIFGLSILNEIIIISVIFILFFWKENIIYYKSIIKNLFLKSLH